MIHTGDSVTVAIKIGQDTETVTMTDNTTGRSWSNTRIWSGELTSVDWIVEAPGNHSVRCNRPAPGDDFGGCPLAPYTPAARFTALQVSGARIGARGVTDSLINGGVRYVIINSRTAVAVPSYVSLGQLLTNGFTIPYKHPGS
jgi:hypothetical protein